MKSVLDSKELKISCLIWLPFSVRHPFLWLFQKICHLFTVNYCHKIDKLGVVSSSFSRYSMVSSKINKQVWKNSIFFVLLQIFFSSLYPECISELEDILLVSQLENTILWQSNILKINSHLVRICLRRSSFISIT